MSAGSHNIISPPPVSKQSIDGLLTTVETSDVDVTSDSESVASDESAESEIAPFEEYLVKIEELLWNIGLDGYTAEALQHGYGYQNCVYSLKSDSNPNDQYILRIPVFPDMGEDDERCQDIIDDVALLNHLTMNLSVPRIRVYDATDKNPLNSPYTIQTRLPGQSLDNLWEDMDISNKFAIVEQFVDLLLQLESIQFPIAGKFTAPPELPSTSTNFFDSPPPSINIFDEGGDLFLQEPKTLQDRQGTNVHALLASHIDSCIAEEFLQSDTRDIVLPFLHKTRTVLDEMAQDGYFNHGPHPIVLHHWDLEPRNIMVSQIDNLWTVTGVIDWDGATAEPRPLARRPPEWFWNWDPETFTGYFDSDHHPDEKLSEEGLALKKYFDVRVAAVLPDYLEDAYGKGRWMRRIWGLFKDGLSLPWYLDLMDALAEDWDGRGDAAVRSVKGLVEPRPEAVTFSAPQKLVGLEKGKGLWWQLLGWLSLWMKVFDFYASRSS